MAKKKSCDCLEQVNKELRDELGVVLSTALSINFDAGTGTVAGPFLKVEWIGGPKRNGKRLPTITCTYCPFCGKKK